jgi:phosphoribosyl-ATP pyrophosphohydrolase/phosphoribosyl-AMP cyclohydrolase
MEYPSAVEMPQPDFAKMPDGLLPAVVQDRRTGRVLMLGYMNAEALAATHHTGLVTFFSRSRQKLWTKGETSGHALRLHAIRLDCDADALLVEAEPQGAVCHTGADTCWGQSNVPASFLHRLEDIIESRLDLPPETSYTARLTARGLAKMAQKVGEEAVETVIAALADDREHLLEESADLLFHLLVLLKAKGVRLEEVEDVLERRNALKQ